MLSKLMVMLWLLLEDFQRSHLQMYLGSERLSHTKPANVQHAFPKNCRTPFDAQLVTHAILSKQLAVVSLKSQYENKWIYTRSSLITTEYVASMSLPYCPGKKLSFKKNNWRVIQDILMFLDVRKHVTQHKEHMYLSSQRQINVLYDVHIAKNPHKISIQFFFHFFILC